MSAAATVSDEIEDNLLRAIQIFYAPATGSIERQSAARFLESFQNTTAAWNVSMSFLRKTDSLSVSVLLFAAQTLKHKIVYDWRQLDSAGALGLRQELWQLAFMEESGGRRSPRPLAVQIQLALAALAVQMPRDLWKDPVGDLLAFLASAANGSLGAEVIALLAVIPEQLNNRAIHFSSAEEFEERRSALLELHIDAVIQMILGSLQQNRESETTGLLNCLLAWIQGGGDGSKLIESPEFLTGLFGLLLQRCKEVLDAEEDDVEEEVIQVIEICSELITELILRISGRIDEIDDGDDDYAGKSGGNTGGGANSRSEWFNQLSAHWIPCLAQNLIQLPLRQFACKLKGSSNSERCLAALFSVACEAGEVFLGDLLQSRQENFFVLVEGILQVLEVPGLSCNTLELSFNFWAALTAEASGFSSASASSEDVFSQIFVRVFGAMLSGPLIFQVAQLTSLEEIDKFRDFRHVVGDCLKDCVRVVGSTEALLIIRKHLSTSSTAIQREAGLFALRTISSSVDPRESEALPEIIPLLQSHLQLQISGSESSSSSSRSLRLISAAILNVGCYADWLRYHSNFLPSFLEIISAALQYALQLTPSTASIAVEAPSSVVGSALQSLKYVCESCGGLMGTQYSALEGLFLQVYPSNLLDPRDRADLCEALGLVLGRRCSWSEEELLAALHRVLEPIWQLASMEDYAKILECTMLPENPRTPLIFSQIFLPSFPQLCQFLFASSASEAAKGDSEGCEAWLKVMQVALRNGTAGMVGDFVQGPLFTWLTGGSLSMLAASRQAALYSLSSTIISNQLLARPEGQWALLKSLLEPSNGHEEHEQWCVDRLYLLRAGLVYWCKTVDVAGDGGGYMANFTALLNVSRTPQFLSGLLSRSLSSPEIVALSAFISAILNNFEDAEDGGFGEVMVWLQGVLLGYCEGALLHWPLTHINDLAGILVRSGRCARSPLRSFTADLFQPSVSPLLPRIFPSAANSTTCAELDSLHRDYSRALNEALQSYRPKGLRQFLTSAGEMCRRRR